MEFYTINKLADKLGISRSTVYRNMDRGMPYKELGPKKMFILEDVLKWMDEKKEVH